jgi:hypothetical protein
MLRPNATRIELRLEDISEYEQAIRIRAPKHSIGQQQQQTSQQRVGTTAQRIGLTNVPQTTRQ